jgi:alkanesulfonate monooxygenase SsuD/methylene tetrahydromethanopterin reductase-like flavin-dependent oxidoreductase (luciferase family)
MKMQIDIEFNSGAQLPMDAIPELACVAESHGFGCIWGGEANNKDPTVMLAAAAASTSRIKVGSAVYHILGRTPITLALQAAGLSELSRGRFLLGVGVSNPTIASWHGLVLDRPLGRVKEYLEIARRAMGGEKLNYDGKYFSSHGFKIAFQSGATSVPIYLAAFGPKMTRLAGTISDGVLINMANPLEIRRIADVVRQSAKDAGKNPAAVEIICKIRCSVAQSYAAAREALSHAVTYYALADYYRTLLARMGFAAEVEAMYAAWKSGGFHAARELVSESLFRGLPFIAATSVDEVLEQIRPYAEAGATRIILPYVAASDDVVGEVKRFVSSWNPAMTGLELESSRRTMECPSNG